jgi:hypothetical protein
MNNCNFTADILVTVTTLVQTIANCVFLIHCTTVDLDIQSLTKGNHLITNSVATTCMHTDKYTVVRRFLSKNTPFLQLKASVFALATPMYI